MNKRRQHHCGHGQRQGSCHSRFPLCRHRRESSRVFNQGLVLGVAYTGRIDRTAVMFGKGSEIVIDDGLVAVASCDGRFQIVGDYCRRSPFKIQHGILASLDQVFLALRPYGLTVGVMTEQKDGNKDFGLFCLAGHLINYFKPVTGKVNVHLVCGIVPDMADDLDVKLILTDGPLEGRQLQTVRILLEQLPYAHPLACQAGNISGKQGLQLSPSWGRLPTTGIPTAKQPVQLLLGEGQKPVNTLAA
ncbi:hypothetical protein HMPREF1199_01604 [Hoylesella oralis CC98A]|nr:hypothetical protein HMPREF1199_01604 [Hoylesella oralis CC98A]